MARRFRSFTGIKRLNFTSETLCLNVRGMRDYYEILGVNRNADPAQLKAAFKRLAMLYHPDRNPNNQEAEEVFKIINEAYHILSDPEKKSQYDMQLYGFAQAYEEIYWQQVKQRRYYQWKKAQESTYRFDRNYFKIQGLAFLVFMIIAGFCFTIIHTAHYYVRQQYIEKIQANNRVLKHANGLFGAGKFEDAFNTISTLEKKAPLDFRLGFARDSLIDALRHLANQEFRHQHFSVAVTYYTILKKYEHPMRFETLENISMCQYYLGNYEESLQALKHLHNQQSRNLGLIYQIAIINLEKLNNTEEALHYFNMGKKLFKENLSHVYGAAFQIVMNPYDAPDVYYHIFLGRAHANLKLKNYDEAVTDCNWAIFLRKEQAEPYYIRALAGIDKKDFRYVCKDLATANQLGIININGLQRKYCF
jgi:DnaJ-domain-containing protein 1